MLRTEIDATVTEVYRILADLRPSALDESGLEAAIRRRLDAMAAPIPVLLRTHELPQLPADVEEAIYHVTGEAVTNALKHANATGIQVDLRTRRGEVRVRVQDDGSGCQSLATSGIGMTSMRDRARHVKGHLVVNTAPTGTVVMLTVPIKEDTA